MYPQIFCKATYGNSTKSSTETSCTDIVNYIQELESKKLYESDFIFVANTIDEESFFKEQQLKKAIQIMKISDEKEKFSLIYDEIYNYLQDDFICNNYCDFKNNKCIVQRRFHVYPPTRTDGCCFKVFKKCNHLVNGNCTIKCLPCTLFSCEYLTKRGIGYWTYEFVLLKAFLDKKQQKHLIWDFYEDKEDILKKLL